MFISHKSNVLQTVHETEWQCRRLSKGMSKPEYGAWIATITTQDEKDNDVVITNATNQLIITLAITT